jgi:amino acid transporter
MDIRTILSIYPVVLIVGLIVLGVTFAYILWHFFFMGIFPVKRALSAKLKEKSLLYTPELGFTLADGGEELNEKREEGNEKERVS